MKVVIPLAGKDERFEKAYKNPKPLIDIDGIPLIKRCADSLSWLFEASDIYLIVLKEHEDKYNITSELKKIFPKAHISILNEMTEGAACTVLTLKEHIDEEEELVIYLADILFESDIETKIKNKAPKVKGFIPTFNSQKEKYSYALLSKEEHIQRVAEKEVISNNASAGFYYFSHGKDFVWAAEQMIKKNLRTKNLFFICPVYNHLIERGDKIYVVESKFVAGLGSPEEIEEYKKKY